MSDIYLSITETPSVVTLSQPVISGALSSTVTVANTVTVALDANSLSALEQVTVTVGAAVTVANFPPTQTVAGTVTANLSSSNLSSATIGIRGKDYHGVAYDVPVNYREDSGAGNINLSVPVFLTTGAAGLGVTTANPLQIAGTVTVGNSVTIDSLPAISGTVTVGAVPNGTLTTRFGTPVTANTAFATSAVTNSSRKYLLIQNVTTSSNVITVGIGFTPTTTQGIQLTPGAGITFESSYIPTGAVYVLSSVTASNFSILEA